MLSGGCNPAMTSAYMAVKAAVFGIRCAVCCEIYHQQCNSASGLVTNSASACLSTIIAPDVWTFLRLINPSQCEKNIKNIWSYSLQPCVFFIGSNWGCWLYEATANCCICPNGLGRGHLEHGRAPRLSLCHLPLCPPDTLLFKQTLNNDCPGL